MTTNIKTISCNGKNLFVAAVSLGGGDVNINFEFVQDIFDELSPFMNVKNNVLYCRDIKEYSIEGKLPGGHTYIDRESMISVPAWPADQQALNATVAHELHHMARWQNAGYGQTLGEAITTEGIATYYEALKSNWMPPWAQTDVSQKVTDNLLSQWDNAHYDHAAWFFQSEIGKWVGYSIGYKLAKKHFDNKFDVKGSLRVKADVFKKLLLA